MPRNLLQEHVDSIRVLPLEPGDGGGAHAGNPVDDDTDQGYDPKHAKR